MHVLSETPGPGPQFLCRPLPYSGSILLEQTLARHSGIEGTKQLPNVLNSVRAFDCREVCLDAYLKHAVGGHIAVLGLSKVS